MDTSSSWFPLLVAALLAGLTLWLNQVAEKALTPGGTAVAHVPDLVVDRFVATAFDAQGYPRHVLTASRMTHYMDDDTTELVAPRVTQQAPGIPATRIESRRGQVSRDGVHVDLVDAVRVERAAAAGGSDLVMTTDYLRVTPDAQQMRTHRPVRLEQGASVLSGDTLFSDGKARVVQIRGHVRGVHEVRH